MKKKQILVAALLTGMLLPESIFSAETKGIENNTGKTNEIGSAGNETDYPAPMLKVTIDENGYAVMASFLTDIVQADPATKRQIQSEENAKENFIEYMKELYSETWNEIELQEDTFEAQLVYIPVDQGKRKTSYYKNITKREN